MEKEFYNSLITNKLSGNISIEEQEQLTNWLKTSSDNQQVYDQLEADWALSATAKKTIDVDVDKDFLTLKNRIQKEKSAAAKSEIKESVVGEKLETEKGEKPKVIPLRSSRYRGLSIAASILLLIGAAWFLLSPEEIAQQMVVVTTTGETRTITLADGTKVWMNENSKLDYPETFVVGSRKVSLQGEAYFEVAKNEKAPFSVELRVATITVLGTQFNIEETKAAVTVHVDEGKVRLAENVGSEKIELTANQAAVYSSDQETQNISKLTTYNKNTTSWKSNALVFEGAKLSEVLTDIGIHFGNTAELELESMRDCIFSGYYPNADANSVLSNVAGSFGMTLTQDRNGNYLLTGGECKIQE